MKKLLLRLFLTAVTLIAVIKSSLYAQYYYYNDKYYDKDLIWEVGGSAGTMFGITDVGRKNFNPLVPAMLDFKSTQINGTFYLGFLYQGVAGVRAEITYGSIAGADSNGNFKTRNLSYKTSIREIALLAEAHPLMLNYWDRGILLSPYVVGGIGWLSFNPQTYYNGKWVDLQPLRTEGQGFAEFPGSKPYRLSKACLPFGGGVKYELSGLINVRAEVLMRYTFTDYLDDASGFHIDGRIFYDYFPAEKARVADALSNRYKEKNPTANYSGAVRRGSPKTKDKYVSFNIKVGLALGRERTR